MPVPAFLSLQSPPQESVGHAHSALDFYRQSDECKAVLKDAQDLWLKERGISREEVKGDVLSALRGYLNRETVKAFRDLDAAERSAFTDKSEQEKVVLTKQRTEIAEQHRSQSCNNVSERRRCV